MENHNIDYNLRSMEIQLNKVSVGNLLCNNFLDKSYNMLSESEVLVII